MKSQWSQLALICVIIVIGYFIINREVSSHDYILDRVGRWHRITYDERGVSHEDCPLCLTVKERGIEQTR